MSLIVHRACTLCEATCSLRFEVESDRACGVSHQAAVIRTLDQLNNEGV